MLETRIAAAFAADGATAVTQEIVHAAWDYAALQPGHRDVRLLYEFAAELQRALRAAEAEQQRSTGNLV